MKTINIGILAHVDAGKTSLTERLLFEAGVIKTLGSVDKGTTQTDAMVQERRRGITIRAAVTSFAVGEVKVNLIDTPGHPDFIAEVERSLQVLDAVILVVSAVEGVQAQTRVLARTLQKMHIPAIIFINKMDRLEGRALPDIQVISDVTRYPMLRGSAITGAGVRELMNTLPALSAGVGARRPWPLSAHVFKIERGKHNEKIVYLRIFGGELRARKVITLHGESESTGRITAMQIFKDGQAVSVNTAGSGEIVKVWGLSDACIGNYIGERPQIKNPQFARPNLETTVAPRVLADKTRLHQALQAIAEQDPLIEMHTGPLGDLSVRLYGEVQREIILAQLLDEYHLEAEFSQPRIRYVEKVSGIGESYAQKFAPDNMFVATLGLRVRPGSPGSGIAFVPDAGIGRIPGAYMKVVEEMVRTTLQEGVYGWEVIDCIVEITRAGYESAMSTGTDFRRLTPLLVAEALQRAGTVVCEPVNRFEIEIPTQFVARVVQALASIGAVTENLEVPSQGMSRLHGLIPLRKVHDFERSVPGLTQGEGFFTAEPAGYRQVHGPILQKARTGNNPFNKEEYLRLTLKRGVYS